MRFRLLFALLAALLLLSACHSISVVTNRDTGYKERLTNVLVWESGALQEKYSGLEDRMARFRTALVTELERRGIKVTTLTTRSLDLNPNELLRSEVRRVGAKQVLNIYTIRATFRTTVEFYDVGVNVLDIGTNREVWKATIGANFYSAPDEMAKKLIGQLQQDGML